MMARYRQISDLASLPGQLQTMTSNNIGKIQSMLVKREVFPLAAVIAPAKPSVDYVLSDTGSDIKPSCAEVTTVGLASRTGCSI